MDGNRLLLLLTCVVLFVGYQNFKNKHYEKIITLFIYGDYSHGLFPTCSGILW